MTVIKKPFVSEIETDLVNQKSLLEGHLKSLNQHLDGLSKKNYVKYAKELDCIDPQMAGQNCKNN
jgi:hypothetical protein